MNALLPKKNQRIELQTSLRSGRRFPTWVEDVRPPRVAVAPPMDQEHYVPLSPGDQVFLHYYDGRGDFTLTGVVLERQGRGGSVMVEALEVSRVQRRQFFRWEGRYPVWFRVLTGEDGEDETDPPALAEAEEWLSAHTRDLSGGGLSLFWNEEIPSGTKVVVELRLPTGAVRAEGRVARTWTNEAGGPGRFIVGVEFTRITDANQRKLMQFIFQEELRFRRR